MRQRASQKAVRRRKRRAPAGLGIQKGVGGSCWMMTRRVKFDEARDGGDEGMFKLESDKEVEMVNR